MIIGIFCGSSSGADPVYANAARETGRRLARKGIEIVYGGGTLDELFEQWTWTQLGIHGKACGILNVNGYFDPLKEMTLRMVAEGFLHESYAGILAFTDDLDVLLTHLHSFVHLNRKWHTEAV